MKKVFLGVVANLAIMAGLVAVFGLIVFLIWNTAIVWAVPTLGGMGFLTSLGIATLFVVINNICTFWTNRFIEVKKVKSMEALEVARILNHQMSSIKLILLEKGIINDEDKRILDSVYSVE